MSRTFSLITVAISGIFWASSGIAVQDFFSYSNKSALDLTNIRLNTAGLILLLISWKSGGFKKSFLVLKSKKKILIDLIIYGIIGMGLVQLSYFAGIAIGGAVATTVIQYSCPAFVILWHSFYCKKFPKLGEFLAVIFASIGVILLVTGGNLNQLLVPIGCIIWSLISGASFAFASIYPQHLFAANIDKCFLTGTGMLTGGLISFFAVDDLNWFPFFESDVIFDFVWIIIFGTVIPFLFYNIGLNYLTAEEASITATTEPLASVVISYFIFGTAFGFVESIGIILVILAILTPTFIKK